jgi:hypothetical protein
MAFDYVRIRDGTVEPLFDKFGKPGQIAVNVPATGALPYESQIDGEDLYDIVVIQTTFEKDNNRGTLVQETDVLFLVSTKTEISPEMADRIIVENVTYQIVRVDPLTPGPTIMLWSVHARK